jgi:hypothetical protein
MKVRYASAFAVSALVLVLVSSVPLASALVRLDGEVLPNKDSFKVKNVGTESATVTMVGYYLPGEGIAWRDIDPDLVLVINEENVLPIPSDFQQKYDQGLRIVVLDSNGASHPIKMRPTADFTYSVSGTTVWFTDTSFDSDGWVVSWSWNFGDRDTNADQNPSHTYADPGVYNVTLIVKDDDDLADNKTVSLYVEGFNMSVSPTSGSAVQGGSATATVTVSSVAGFSSPVSLSASGLPSGASASFSTNPVAPPANGSASLTMTVSTSSSTPAGTYAITITGTGGGLTRDRIFTLAVNLPSYTLTTSVSPAGSGSVSPSSGTYVSGTNVSLTATPASGWRFDHWGGNASGSSNPITITMNSNRSVTAYFVLLNRPPTAPTSLSLNSPKVGEVLTATASGSTDPDDDPITYYYKFYNQSDSILLRDWSATNTYTIRQSDAHDRITVYAKAYDGYEYSGEISSSKTVANTAPTTPSSLSLSPTTIYAGNTLTASASGSTDADGDTITYYYKFYNQTDLAVLKDWSTLNSYVVQQSDVGDTIVVYAKAYDGYEYSGEKTSNKTVADFTINVSPASGSVNVGGSTTTTVSIGSIGGFNSTVTLEISSWGPLSSWSFGTPSGTPSFSSSLAMNVSSSASPGTYTIAIKGTGGGKTHYCYYSLTVLEPDFTMSISPTSGSVSAGSSATATVTLTSINGFNSSVSLSVSGVAPVQWLEPGQTLPEVTLSSSSVALPADRTATSTMTIRTFSSTPAGTYTITITGSGGGKTHNCTYTLTVNPDFSVEAVSFIVTYPPGPVAYGTVTAGESIDVMVTVTSLGGFNSKVTLSASGLPPLTSVGFTYYDTSLIPTYKAKLTIYTSPMTPAGTYTMTITGTGGGKTRSSTYTLTVKSLPDFAMSISPTSGSIVQTTVRYYQYSGTYYNQMFNYQYTIHNILYRYSGTNYNRYYAYSGTNYNKYFTYSGTNYNRYWSYTGYNYNKWWYYYSYYGGYYFWSDYQINSYYYYLVKTEYRYEGTSTGSWDAYQGSSFTTPYKDGYTAWYYSSSYVVGEGSAGSVSQDTYQGSNYTTSYKDGYTYWSYTGYGYWNEGSAGTRHEDTYQGSSFTTPYKDGYALWTYTGYGYWNEGSTNRDFDIDQGTSDFKTYDYKDGYILWSGSSRVTYETTSSGITTYDVYQGSNWRTGIDPYTVYFYIGSFYVNEGSAGTREYTTYKGSSFRTYDYKDGYVQWDYTGYRDATQGGSTTTTISISSIGGFNSPVTITIAYPSGSGLTFFITSNPMQVPSSATLTIQTASSTPEGTYTITVIGTSGSLSHSCTYILTVK